MLDCASFIAGPAAATIMSDFGARVIKIEPPDAGDSYRQLMKVPGMPPAERDYFWTLDNRNKESLALDLKHAEARPILETLIRKADVFITNFPEPHPRAPEACAQRRAAAQRTFDLRLAHALRRARSGKDRTGYDATAWWARSGMMDAVRATPQTEPGFSVPGMGDHPTAVALFAAIVSGLYRRERTGKGGVVSTSLLANGLWSNGCWMQAALCDADFSVRLQRGQRGALTEIYACKDNRWFMLVLLNQAREWPLLLQAVGHPEWADDTRFATPELRKANTPALLQLLEQIFLTRVWADWRTIFQQAGITYGPIAQAGDHLACPQVKANGMLPEFSDANGLRTVDSPIRIAGIDKAQPRMAPKIGEHTREVLREAGCSAADIDRMLAAGAVAT